MVSLLACLALLLTAPGAETQPVDETLQNMVLIAAGPFIQGSDHPRADDDEKPAQRRHLPAYWLDRDEVTNAQFAAFVDATQYRTQAEEPDQTEGQDGISWRQPEGTGSDVDQRLDHPVVYVSWRDAQAYCTWRGKRLPTEAEWEKGARSADGRIWPWGDQPGPDRANTWGSGDPFSGTAPVGSLPQGHSPYGLRDMAGNVWEWCADWYTAPATSLPTAPADSLKVLRGGSWINPIHTARSSNRFEIIPQERSAYVGFRCACTP
ncbi:MAG: SUMF1/EgtB/PvdO family nonheme iron enzyme [Candidatus Latescibacteria bacterium]|nr:SUMF1/EgtB/PvdO family nonheme iron enzyme [Candidatus Latescibacterota bacterium]